MDFIDKRKLRTPDAKEKGTEAGERTPENVIDLSELSSTVIFNARERYAERAEKAKSEITAGGEKVRASAAKESIELDPEDDRKLKGVEAKAEEAVFDLLQKLDAAKRKLDDAQVALEKASGTFSGLTKSRRDARAAAADALTSAEQEYQAQILALQKTEKGKQALGLLNARERLVQAEHGEKKHGKGAAKSYIERSNAAVEYNRKKQEILGENLSAALTEQAALADTRALERRSGELGIYRLNKALGNANLGELLNWNPSNRFAKMISKGINARTAVNLALVGGGVLLAGSGAGFAVGAAAGSLYLTRKLVGGTAAAAGTYDLLRVRKSAKVEHAVASQDFKELTDQELLEATAQLESQAILNGNRVSDNEIYQRILAERARRGTEKRVKTEKKKGGTEILVVKRTLQQMMADTDAAYKKVFEQEKNADRKLRVISIGVGAFVASGAVSEILKGAWHGAGAVADATGVSEASGRIAKRVIDATVGTAQAAEPAQVPGIEEAAAIQPMDTRFFTMQFDSVAEHLKAAPEGKWVQDGMEFRMMPNGHIDAHVMGQHLDLGTRAQPDQANWGFVLGYAQAQHPIPEIQVPPVDGGAVIQEPAEVHVDPLADRPAVQHDGGPEPIHHPAPEAAPDEIPPIAEADFGRILDAQAPVAERAAALKALIQEKGADVPAGRVVTTPDGSTTFVVSPDGRLGYVRWIRGTMAPEGPQVLDSEEAWVQMSEGRTDVGPHADEPVVTGEPVGEPATSRTGELARPEDSLTPEPSTKLEAPNPEVATGAYLTKFFDNAADMGTRRNALHAVIERMGHAEGGEKTFSMGTWNVRLYESPDGHFSYAMTAPDGNVISPRIPLESQSDWQNMSTSMHTDVTPHEHGNATGLFTAEADKAARMETQPHFPTPKQIAEGAVHGIRTADAGLDRGLDTGANWLANQGSIDGIDPERQDELMGRLGIPEDRIQMVHDRVRIEHHDELPDPGKGAEFRAERAAAAAAKDKAALDAAAAQHDALKPPTVINPEASRIAHEQLATGQIRTPSGVTLEFEANKKGFEIEVTGGVSREEAVRQLLGPDYRRIIETPGVFEQDHNIQIRYIEEHAQALANYLKVRDYMIANGLTDAKQYEALQDAIAQEKANVSRFGHVIADDPQYGKPSTMQTVGRFISVHDGVYRSSAPFTPAVGPEHTQEPPVYVDDPKK